MTAARRLEAAATPGAAVGLRGIETSKRWHEPLGAGRLRSGPPPLGARDSQCGTSELQRRPLMAILAGFDVHRAQITFDALNTETGEVLTGRMRSDREAVGEWVGRFAGERVEVAVEACTGWLFVYEVLASMGVVVHLAEPAETSALRGKKRHAKTDRADARWLRTLLVEGRLPEAWIPPAHVREWRTQTRLRKTLIDERTSWAQRIQATLFHHGIVDAPDQLLRADGRAFLRALTLPPAATQRIEIALAIIDEIERQLVPLPHPARTRARRARPDQLNETSLTPDR